MLLDRREFCAREEALRLKLEQLNNEHKRVKEVMVSTIFLICIMSNICSCICIFMFKLSDKRLKEATESSIFYYRCL